MSENTNRATREKVRFSMTLQNYSELNTQTSHVQISCIDTLTIAKQTQVGRGSEGVFWHHWKDPSWVRVGSILHSFSGKAHMVH